MTSPEGKSVLDTIAIDTSVPPDFPEKYFNARVNVADLCDVKKTILHPPKFAINTVVQQ